MMEETKVKGGFTVDWNKIKAEYIAGGTSYRKLAEKYGASESTLKKKAAKEHWSELRSQAGTKTELKIVDSVSDKNAEDAVSAASLISEAAMNFLKQIAAESIRLARGEIEAEYRTKYSEYALALARFKDVLDIKSEKDIEEQQARIDNLRKQAQKDDTNNDKKIEIEYNGMEDYSE